MKTITIHSNDSNQRVDRFLKKAFPSLPDSMIYKGIRKKQIKVNRKRCTGDMRLQEGDILTLFLPDDLLQPADTHTKKTSAAGNADALHIVYEDQNVLILYKPVGILTHSDANHPDHCLVNHLHDYLQKTGAYCPEQEQSFAPAVCNRLDRNTEGLVIAAKNAAALREINRLIREDRIQKSYLCIVSPAPKKKAATLYAYHQKNNQNNTVSISDTPKAGYREIVTSYRILQQTDAFCLTEVTLHTGRTHQIRAHMAHIGSPLIGDTKYGNRLLNQKLRCSHQLLCAYQLQWNPDADSCLAYLQQRTFTAPMPAFVKRFFPHFSV